MNRADASPKPGDTPDPPAPKDIPLDCYKGVDLAPSTLESLVTWDVSGHAQREKDRLRRASPPPKGTRGGY